MFAHSTKEYNFLRSEEKYNKTCITEYMKEYYKIVIAVIAAVGAIVGYVISHNIYMQNLIFELAGYALIASCFMSHSFSLIVLHKCNTHNKIAGYIRVLTREQYVPSTLPAKGEKFNDLILWEVIQQKVGQKEGENRLSLFTLKWWKQWRNEVRWGIRAFLQVPMKKPYVKDSWTYPLSLSFGLNAPILTAILAWFFYIAPGIFYSFLIESESDVDLFATGDLTVEARKKIAEKMHKMMVETPWFSNLMDSITSFDFGKYSYSLTIQLFLICLYLIPSFLGNMRRVAKLCRHDSSRTIGAYATFYHKMRTVLLKRYYGIEVLPWNNDWDYDFHGTTRLIEPKNFLAEGKLRKNDIMRPKPRFPETTNCNFKTEEEAKEWLKTEAKNRGYDYYYYNGNYNTI